MPGQACDRGRISLSPKKLRMIPRHPHCSAPRTRLQTLLRAQTAPNVLLESHGLCSVTTVEAGQSFGLTRIRECLYKRLRTCVSVALMCVRLMRKLFQSSTRVNERLRYGLPMAKCCSHGTLVLIMSQDHPPEYLLLPPRSALSAAPVNLTANLLRSPTRHPTRQGLETLGSDPYTSELCAIDGHASGESFSAIHFQGCSLRQVGCYTLLSGCQLP